MMNQPRFNAEEKHAEDDDILEYEEMKDKVQDLQMRLLDRQRKKKSSQALSKSGSKSSMLSKKDYDEIRSLARQGSKKEELSQASKSGSILVGESQIAQSYI